MTRTGIQIIDYVDQLLLPDMHKDTSRWLLDQFKRFSKDAKITIIPPSPTGRTTSQTPPDPWAFPYFEHFVAGKSNLVAHVMKKRTPPPRAHLRDYQGAAGGGGFQILNGEIDFGDLERRMARSFGSLSATPFRDVDVPDGCYARAMPRQTFRKLRRLTRLHGIEATGYEEHVRGKGDMVLVTPKWFAELCDEVDEQVEIAPGLGIGTDRVAATLERMGTQALEAMWMLGGRASFKEVIATTIPWDWTKGSAHTRDTGRDEDERDPHTVAVVLGPPKPAAPRHTWRNDWSRR